MASHLKSVAYYNDGGGGGTSSTATTTGYSAGGSGGPGGWTFIADSDNQLALADALYQAADNFDARKNEMYGKIDNMGNQWKGGDYDLFNSSAHNYDGALKAFSDSIRMYGTQFEGISGATEQLSSELIEIIMNMTGSGTAGGGNISIPGGGGNVTLPGGGTTTNPGGGTTTNPGGGTTNNPGGGTTNNPGGGTTNNPGGTTNNPGGTTNNPGGTTNNPNTTTNSSGGAYGIGDPAAGENQTTDNKTGNIISGALYGLSGGLLTGVLGAIGGAVGSNMNGPEDNANKTWYQKMGDRYVYDWDDYTGDVSRAWSKADGLISGAYALGVTVNETGAMVGNMLTNTHQAVNDTIKTGTNWLFDLGNDRAVNGNYWDTVGEDFGENWDFSTVDNFGEGVGVALTGTVRSVVDAGQLVVNGLADGANAVGDGISWVGDKVNDGLNWLGGLIFG